MSDVAQPQELEAVKDTPAPPAQSDDTAAGGSAQLPAETNDGGSALKRKADGEVEAQDKSVVQDKSENGEEKSTTDKISDGMESIATKAEDAVTGNGSTNGAEPSSKNGEDSNKDDKIATNVSPEVQDKIESETQQHIAGSEGKVPGAETLQTTPAEAAHAKDNKRPAKKAKTTKESQPAAPTRRSTRSSSKLD